MLTVILRCRATTQAGLGRSSRSLEMCCCSASLTGQFTLKASPKSVTTAGFCRHRSESIVPQGYRSPKVLPSHYALTCPDELLQSPNHPNQPVNGRGLKGLLSQKSTTVVNGSHGL